MGAHRLPATLDEFLLLLGPRGPPPRPRPVIKEKSADLKEEERDDSGDNRWPKSQPQDQHIAVLYFNYLEINIVTNMEHDQKMKRWTDAEWPKQWYLNRGGALDMNVEAAWDKGWSLVGLGLVNIILTNFDF